jgi:hypothetical protein
MPDITVHRHGDRWAVAEAGAESPVKEFPTREAAELAARQMAAGGAVEVVEEDPTGLDQSSPENAGEEQATGPDGLQPAEVPESPREPQAGL